MQFTPIITRQAMIFKFRKALYGSFFSIREKWLKIAKARNLNIIAESSDGVATFTYDSWMKGAKRMEMEYNYPGDPMIMYGKQILGEIKKREKRKKIEKKLDEGFSLKGREALLKAWKALQQKI